MGLSEYIRDINFTISNVKPCSINKAYFKHRKVLTVDGRRYRKRLLLSIAENKELVQALRKFSGSFDPKRHVLTLHTTYYIPQDLCLTKAGYLSRRGGDTDNYSKLTTDFLFSPKYAGYKFPGFEDVDVTNVCIDDQFIIDNNSSKRVSPDGSFHIGVSVKMHDIEDFMVESLSDSMADLSTASVFLGAWEES